MKNGNIYAKILYNPQKDITAYEVAKILHLNMICSRGRFSGYENAEISFHNEEGYYIFIKNYKDIFRHFSVTFLNYYICENCGLSMVKLWRLYCSPHIELMCANCLTGFEIDIDSDGMNTENNRLGNKTFQICKDGGGCYIPAIPALDDGIDQSYYGYTSCTQDSINWWKKLPLTKNNEEKNE